MKISVMPDAASAVPGAPAAEAAVRVVELLGTAAEPLSLSEISRRLELNKNMVFRILNTLKDRDWVYADPVMGGKYALTLRPFAVTSRARNRLTLNTAALPFLYQLWEATGDSTYLAVLQNDRALYLQHFDAAKNIKVAGRVGGSYPLHCTAPGKALLAFADEITLRRCIHAPLEERTPNTITDSRRLESHLALIRQRGYALDLEEFGAGIICCAAPVFDDTATAVGAVGCSLSLAENTTADMEHFQLKLVRETAEAISRRLGFMKKPE